MDWIFFYARLRGSNAHAGVVMFFSHLLLVSRSGPAASRTAEQRLAPPNHTLVVLDRKIGYVEGRGRLGWYISCLLLNSCTGELSENNIQIQQPRMSHVCSFSWDICPLFLSLSLSVYLPPSHESPPIPTWRLYY